MRPGPKALRDWLVETNQDPRRKRRFLLLASLLSLVSLRLLPFSYRMHLLPAGLDFANPFWFQNCVAHQDNPYFVAGRLCGDQLNRVMIYPPTMYWSYFWTRGMSLPVAYSLWVLLMVGGMWFSIRQLDAYRRDFSPVAIGLALLVQLPMMFALERGNNDVMIVVTWTLLALWWKGERHFLAGVCGALAFMLKLYPAVPLAILGAASLGRIHRDRRWRRLLGSREVRFASGLLAGIAALWLLNAAQNADYFARVLPAWMQNRVSSDPMVHSIFSIAPGHVEVAYLAGLALGGSWLVVAFRRIDDDPALVFAGLLAISTYFSGVSNDYNLVTVYPLIALCWFRSFEHTERDAYFLLLVTSFLSVIGLRWLWTNPLWHAGVVNLVLEISWLTSFAWFAGGARRPAAAPATAGP